MDNERTVQLEPVGKSVNICFDTSTYNISGDARILFGKFGPGAVFSNTIRTEVNQFILSSRLTKGPKRREENAYPIEIESLKKFVFFERDGSGVVYDCFQLVNSDATDDEIALSIEELDDHFLKRGFPYVILYLA